MKIRDALSRGNRSFFDMTHEERVAEREELRKKDKSDLNSFILWAILPGAVIYCLGTILAVIIRIYGRG